MLTKKERKKRYNKPVKNRVPFQFDGWGQQTGDAFKNNPGGAVAGIAGAASGAIQAGVENATLQGVEEAQAEIDKRSNFASMANTAEDLLSEMAASVDMRTDYTKNDFRRSSGEMAMNTINAGLSGAGSGAAAGPWGAIAGAAAGLLGGGIGSIVGHAKANKTAKNLNEQARQANLAKSQALISKVNALDRANDQRVMAAYAAYGGDINTPKFSDYPSEVTEFNTGGSHEENPYDGIPQGIAPDGLPNLVEEGEVKYDNYVFSDRLMLNKNDKKKYKFLKGKTYADAAKTIKKELGIDERPNDLIAKTDLDEHLNILSTLQEEERAKRGLRGENRMMYKNGGHVFDGRKSTITSYMDDGFTRKEARQAYKLGVDPWDLYDPALSDNNMERAKNKVGAGFSWLQAAPAIGSAVGLISNLFDRPTYEHTKRLTQPEEAISPITYTPTHRDIRLDRFDTNYHANKLAAQAGATRRAIREQTASNPYATTAALLSADANAQSQMGDLYRKAAEYNQGLALQEAQFNSAGRRADAEGLLKAASANATLQDKALSRQAEKDIYAAKLNMAEDQAWNAANSANMTSLFDNLGAIGKENKEIRLAAIKALGEGKITAEQLAGYAKIFPDLAKLLGYKKAYGGQLRKKKGYTI